MLTHVDGCGRPVGTVALVDQPVIVGQAALMAAVYSVLFYAKARQQEDAEFDPTKFGATLLVGVAVGVSIALGGGELFQGTIETKLASYAGVVALVETVLKPVYRQ